MNDFQRPEERPDATNQPAGDALPTSGASASEPVEGVNPATVEDGASETAPTQAADSAGQPAAPEGAAGAPTTPIWSAEAWQAAAPEPQPDQESLPGGAAHTVPLQPVQQARPARSQRGATVALVLAAALISAALASGGTLAALGVSGALNHSQPAAAATANATTASQENVTITEQSAVISAAKNVSPAVVTITTQIAPSNLDPFQLPTTGVGSGFIYNSDGWILTNRHVVQGATNNQVSVQLNDGRTFTGTVYGTDTLTDLAIVKIDATNLPTVQLGDSANLEAGELAIAIGSPLGTFTDTVTSGIVSALSRTVQVGDQVTGQVEVLRNMIQTDAAINPGNSGGPLLNSAGQVIGINTATASQAQGIGFAIPINVAKPIMRQAVAGQKLERPWIGIYYEALDPTLSASLHLSQQYGAYITAPQGSGQQAVIAGSPAAKAGLQSGDIIVAVDGQKIDATHPLDLMLVSYAPGDTIHLQVLRGSQTLDISVTLGVRPANLP